MDGVRPRHRFMSAYEQRMEPPDRQWQYLLFAAEPYETIAFKVNASSDTKHELQVCICGSLVNQTVFRS